MKRAQRLVFNKKNLSALFVFVVSLSCFAEKTSYLLCRRAMDVRTLRVEVHKDQSCATWYSKEGSDHKIVNHKVAESYRLSFCEGVVSQIQSTLLSAGWKCKDISSTRISF